MVILIIIFRLHDIVIHVDIRSKRQRPNRDSLDYILMITSKISSTFCFPRYSVCVCVNAFAYSCLERCSSKLHTRAPSLACLQVRVSHGHTPRVDSWIGPWNTRARYDLTLPNRISTVRCSYTILKHGTCLHGIANTSKTQLFALLM